MASSSGTIRVNQQSFDRRRLFGGIGLALPLTLVGCGESTSGEQSPQANSEDIEPNSGPAYPISASQAETNIGKLTESPDLYKGREEVDPHQLTGKSKDELLEISGVVITEKNRDDLAFADDLAKKMLLLMLAGLTLEDVNIARSQGFAIGERNELGGNLGDFHKYVDQTYGDMIDGLFKRFDNGFDFSEPMGYVENRRSHLASLYEGHLNVSITGDEVATADTTAYIEVMSVQRLDSLMDYGRHLDIELKLTIPNGQDDDIVYSLISEVYLRHGQDEKYEVVLNDFDSLMTTFN